MTDKTSVLIVGAGPVGMVAAGMLRRHGVKVRIVDAAPGVATGSRAIMLWPPALEALDDLDLLAEAEEQGYRPEAFVYHTGPGSMLRVPISRDDAPLVIPQQCPGELLDAELNRLGCPVERQVRVVAVAAGATSVTVETRHADGTEATIEADWLIAADGVRSTVREQLGVAFQGGGQAQRFLLAEGRLDGEIDHDVVHYFLGRSGVVLFAPLPGGAVRIATPIDDDADATPDLLARLIAERGPGSLRMPAPTMLTTFASIEQIAERMRVGRCFLVGDAAHVHSVIGGQGMGLGLQDVRNLAWKLAGVVTGRLDPAVLDSYEPERRAAVEHIVQITGRMTRQAVLGPVALRLRNGALRALNALGVLERVNMPMLAGRRVRYPDALFGGAPAPGSGGRGIPGPGQRAPRWIPAADEPPQGPFLLVTTGSATSELARHADVAATRSPLLGRTHVPRDGDAVMLIRPDGFMAAAGRGLVDVTAIESLVASVAGPAEPAG